MISSAPPGWPYLNRRPCRPESSRHGGEPERATRVERPFRLNLNGRSDGQLVRINLQADHSLFDFFDERSIHSVVGMHE